MKISRYILNYATLCLQVEVIPLHAVLCIFTFFLLCCILNQYLMQFWEENLELFLKGNCQYIFLLECKGRLKNQYMSCDTGCALE